MAKHSDEEMDVSESSSDDEFEEPSSDEDFEPDAAFEDMKEVYDDLRRTCRDAKIGHKITGASFCHYINSATSNGRTLSVVLNPNKSVKQFFVHEAEQPKKKAKQSAETSQGKPQ